MQLPHSSYPLQRCLPLPDGTYLRPGFIVTCYGLVDPTPHTLHTVPHAFDLQPPTPGYRFCSSHTFAFTFPLFIRYGLHLPLLPSPPTVTPATTVTIVFIVVRPYTAFICCAAHTSFVTTTLRRGCYGYACSLLIGCSSVCSFVTGCAHIPFLPLIWVGPSITFVVVRYVRSLLHYIYVIGCCYPIVCSFGLLLLPFVVPVVYLPRITLPPLTLPHIHTLPLLLIG